MRESIAEVGSSGNKGDEETSSGSPSGDGGGDNCCGSWGTSSPSLSGLGAEPAAVSWSLKIRQISDEALR